MLINCALKEYKEQKQWIESVEKEASNEKLGQTGMIELDRIKLDDENRKSYKFWKLVINGTKKCIKAGGKQEVSFISKNYSSNVQPCI